MVVEPMAGDSVSDHLNQVGRAYYGFSILVCTRRRWPKRWPWPSAPRLGTHGIRDVVTTGGFARFTSVAKTKDPASIGLRNTALTVVVFEAPRTPPTLAFANMFQTRAHGG
jgi:hypothetical protein